jgi:hypothetical protein
MVLRRSLLKACSLAAVGLAGCNDADTNGGSPAEQPPSGNPTARAPAEGNRISIVDHGAAVDGTTDDTAAIRDAIEAAGPGDVVTFPAGTTLVSGDDKSQPGVAAIPIDGDAHASNLTLRGEGEASVVQMDGGHERDHKIFEIRVRSGIKGLTLENITIDGAAADQPQADGDGGWNVNVGKADNDEVVPDVTFRNLWVRRANQNGFRVAHGGCSFVRCTARECNLHGFAVDSWGETRNVDPPITVRKCYAVDNGLYGIDCSGGKVLVEDFVAENNRLGTKTTPEVLETVYRRCRFNNNEMHGYNRPTTATKTGQRATVTFTAVIAEGNGRAGIRFGFDTDYHVNAVLTRRNNTSGEDSANILMRDNSTVDAALVMSYDAQIGAGIRYGSSGPASIETYVHAGNPEGDLIADQGGLEIRNSLTRRKFRERRMEATDNVVDRIEELARRTDGGILGVPTAAEVGAGSGP